MSFFVTRASIPIIKSIIVSSSDSRKYAIFNRLTAIFREFTLLSNSDLNNLPTASSSAFVTRGVESVYLCFFTKVVHGEAITEKLRIIKLREDAEISSVDLARNILENLILAVTERREFLDPSNIDEFFFEKYELMKEINDWKQADCGDGVISETD